MRKLLYSVILLAILIIPGKVFAISGTVNLKCTPTSVFAGDAINCTISGDVSDGSITDFTATTQLSDNLEFVSAATVSGWTGTSNGGIFSLKTTNSQTNVFEIANFTVKMKNDSTSSGTVTLNTTKLGEVTSVPPVSQNINLSTSTNVADTADDNAGEDVNADIKNPGTGSSIPFMVIGAGVIGAIVVYELAARKKKIYKI